MYNIVTMKTKSKTWFTFRNLFEIIFQKQKRDLPKMDMKKNRFNWGEGNSFLGWDIYKSLKVYRQ